MVLDSPSRRWTEAVKNSLDERFCFYEVDAHNVVPVWEASDKREFAARTIRPKIQKKLPEFLVEFPSVKIHAEERDADFPLIDWDSLIGNYIRADESVPPVEGIYPAGTRAGLQRLDDFAVNRIKLYDEKRNDPNVPEALSGLSPYFHFGQIAPQRAVLHVRGKCRGRSSAKASVEAFEEECVIRRELADNFCFYTPNCCYDTLEGAPDWAVKTLNDHRRDKREYVYSEEMLENCDTHDGLWNAAQRQMALEGKMHGFLRMYWAKKILEWTESPEEALRVALRLNDKYNLDGRDPNGVTGVMWSIGGVHDQGWKERPVFGKIRYMNYQGCKRKFDVDAFEKKYAKQ